jgi:Toastrack DUF4097
MKNLGPALISGALLIMVASTPVLAESCRASKNINEEISIDTASELRVNVLAGYLDIQPGTADEVSFTGLACADEEKWLERMSLDVERQGDVLELTVIIPYDDRDFDAEYAYMDIDLRIPAHLQTKVKDSSGDITITGVSMARVDDSSGNIRISQNKIPLEIRDSSGNMEILDQQGDLEIMDSSGSIEVENVIGSVLIPRDSSGEIDIETVAGKVTIERDGSGDIDIRDVESDVEIGSDGSGGIRVRDVKGGVLIGSDGSGQINIANISGSLLVEAKGSGDVRTHGIEGEISLPR